MLKKVQILRADNHQSTEAHIIRLPSAIAKAGIDSVWWKGLPQDVVAMEGDSHWIWERIAMDYSTNPLYDCVALVSSSDGYIEGAIAYRFDAKSSLSPLKGCLYIGWLASAPRNRNWIVDNPEYIGVGTVLFEWALTESYNAGLGGRISLESLPTGATIRFYENKGFVETGARVSQKGLINYELSDEAAEKWLQKLGE